MNLYEGDITPRTEWLLAAGATNKSFFSRANSLLSQQKLLQTESSELCLSFAFMPRMGYHAGAEWMENFSFKKTERLAKRPQFENVMAEGKKKRVERLCIIFSLPNELDRRRLGIIASKKIGNAVARNRVKRRIREIFRQIKHRMEPALDIVVISGKDMVTLPYGVIEKKLSNTLLTES